MDFYVHTHIYIYVCIACIFSYIFVLYLDTFYIFMYILYDRTIRDYAENVLCYIVENIKVIRRCSYTANSQLCRLLHS